MQSELVDDPYTVLGLSRTAGPDELKRAYRKLSMAWHPDRHANASDAQRTEAERRFKIVNAAYVAIGELLRTKDAGQHASAAPAATARSDAKVAAIRSVVASVALRVIPNLPRHTYRRVVSMVEALLLDSIALGDRAFAGGFATAVREALEMAGLGPDSREDALRVLDAAADELQWRGKGADPQTWQRLLRPLDLAMHPDRANGTKPGGTTAPTLTLANLPRTEPAALVAQGALTALFLLLLLPLLPIGGGLHLLLLVLNLAVLAYITLSPHL